MGHHIINSHKANLYKARGKPVLLAFSSLQKTTHISAQKKQQHQWDTLQYFIDHMSKEKEWD